MEEDSFECHYCEAEFKVTHEHINEVVHCPFCGIELEHEDEDDDPDKDDE